MLNFFNVTLSWHSQRKTCSPPSLIWALSWPTASMLLKYCATAPAVISAMLRRSRYSRVLTKDSPENRSFFGEGVKVVVEVVVDPQRQIDHFDDLGDDLRAAAEPCEKVADVAVVLFAGTVRSLPVKSWSSGMRR